VVSFPDITSSTCVGGYGQWCTRNGNNMAYYCTKLMPLLPMPG